MKKYYLMRKEISNMHSKEGRLAGHTLRRNCLLKRITEEKIGGGRRERRRTQLLEDFKETKG
jgi:hypothetical protein